MPEQTVSVLIPTCNRADWLVECLEAILGQTRPPDEIIVIDDGSSDKTTERLQPFQPLVRVVSQQNAGKAAALNRGLAKAKGNLVWIMDDDDIAATDALETLLGLLASDPGADFAYGRHDRFRTDPRGRTRWMDQGYWRNSRPSEFLFDTMLDLFVHQPAMLVKKDLYEQAGPFDETLVRSQDYDMLVRLALHGRPASTRRVVFHQRQHDSARGRQRCLFPARDRNTVWQKHDRTIFRRLHGSLGLKSWLATGTDMTEPRARRRAVLRRAVVMARKGLWSLAADDFTRAAQMSGAPLQAEDAADLRQVFMSKYGCESMLDDPAARAVLQDLKHLSGAGRQMSRHLGLALVWRVREAVLSGRFLTAARFMGLIGHLVLPSIHRGQRAAHPTTGR